MTHWRSLTFVALATFVQGCGPQNSASIEPTLSPMEAPAPTDATLYPWPFSVPSVTLACRNPAGPRHGDATVTTDDGREFALNGLARRSHPDVMPIWLPDPQTEGLRISVGPAISRALDLCLNSGEAAPPLRVAPGRPPPAPERVAPAPSPPLPKIDQSQLRLTVLSAIESNGSVTGEIGTNLPLPVEVMVGLSLRGQQPNDVFIGNDQRVTLSSARQSYSIPLTTSRGQLPSGRYDVEVTFYPRWGAENGSPAARAITRELRASRPIELRGSGQSASSAIRRNEAQRWLMMNVDIQERFDLAEYERHLGPSQRFRPSGRTGIVMGYYFSQADATIFMSEPLNEVLVWRLGRHSNFEL